MQCITIFVEYTVLRNARLPMNMRIGIRVAFLFRHAQRRFRFEKSAVVNDLLLHQH